MLCAGLCLAENVVIVVEWRERNETLVSGHRLDTHPLNGVVQIDQRKRGRRRFLTLLLVCCWQRRRCLRRWRFRQGRLDGSRCQCVVRSCSVQAVESLSVMIITIVASFTIFVALVVLAVVRFGQLLAVHRGSGGDMVGNFARRAVHAAQSCS